MVMPGSDWFDLPVLQTVAGQFGWDVDVANDLPELAKASPCRKTVAILLHHDALGPGYSWHELIMLLTRTLPDVRVVACIGFQESIHWPELCDAGAFYALWLPLKENELRQCLGFVWEAERRAGSTSGDLQPLGDREISSRDDK